MGLSFDPTEVDKIRKRKVSKVLQILEPKFKRSHLNSSSVIVKPLQRNQIFTVRRQAVSHYLGQWWFVFCGNKVARLCLKLLTKRVLTVQVNKMHSCPIRYDQRWFDTCHVAIREQRFLARENDLIIVHPDNFQGVVCKNYSEVTACVYTVLLGKRKITDFWTEPGYKSTILFFEMPLHNDCLTACRQQIWRVFKETKRCYGLWVPVKCLNDNFPLFTNGVKRVKHVENLAFIVCNSNLHATILVVS